LNAIPEDIGNIRRPIRAATQRCHGHDIVSLLRCQPVKTHPEKPLIQPFNSFRRRSDHILRIDGRLPGDIPGLKAPFLKKIRISLGFIYNLVQGVGRYRFPFTDDGLFNRFLGGKRIKYR
jgi:hypothetical protein